MWDCRRVGSANLYPASLANWALPGLQGLLPVAAPQLALLPGKGWWALSSLAALGLSTATYQVRWQLQMASRAFCAAGCLGLRSLQYAPVPQRGWQGLCHRLIMCLSSTGALQCFIGSKVSYMFYRVLLVR